MLHYYTQYHTQEESKGGGGGRGLGDGVGGGQVFYLGEIFHRQSFVPHVSGDLCDLSSVPLCYVGAADNDLQAPLSLIPSAVETNVRGKMNRCDANLAFRRHLKSTVTQPFLPPRRGHTDFVLEVRNGDARGFASHAANTDRADVTICRKTRREYDSDWLFEAEFAPRG